MRHPSSILQFTSAMQSNWIVVVIQFGQNVLLLSNTRQSRKQQFIHGSELQLYIFDIEYVPRSNFIFFSIRIFMGDWVIYSQSMINTLAHKHTHTHTPCKMRVRVRASERGGKRKETIYGTLQLHMYSTTITTNTRTHSQTIRYLLLWLCHPHYYCPFFIQSNREEIGTK